MNDLSVTQEKKQPESALQKLLQKQSQKQSQMNTVDEEQSNKGITNNVIRSSIFFR